MVAKNNAGKDKKLYDSDALGVPDDDLCNDVGIRLYCRVQTIYYADNGLVECPECGTVFKVEMEVIGWETPVNCTKSGCTWFTTNKEWKGSKRHREIGAGNAAGAVNDFYKKYPEARTYKEKILLIDRIIHEFHWDEKINVTNRSIGNNLIEGDHRQVMKFLDNLSSIDNEVKVRWRTTAKLCMERRGGKPIEWKETGKNE